MHSNGREKFNDSKICIYIGIISLIVSTSIKRDPNYVKGKCHKQCIWWNAFCIIKDYICVFICIYINKLYKEIENRISTGGKTTENVSI